MSINAAGIMYEKNGTILLLRRTDNGLWAFPAGKIEEGETPEICAIRESEEEIGVRPQNLKFVSNKNGFHLYFSQTSEFMPKLNYEHDQFLWADRNNLPDKLHPGVLEAIMTIAQDSAREIDVNGYMEVKENPIIREGVFPYLGSSIDPNGYNPDIEPNKIYYVYRPAEEIEKAKDTFKLNPFIDEHTMLGPSDEGFTPAEKKGVHGITGESVDFKNGVLYSNLKIFSEKLASLIKAGKKELSLGYRCSFIKQAGTFAGQAYDFVQRSLHGNHLALVDKGRNNVSVLDKSIVFDHLDINLKKDQKMPTIEELSAQVAALDEAVKDLKQKNLKLQAALDEKEKEEKKAEDEDEEKKDDKAEDEDDKEKEEKAEDDADGQGMPPEKEVEMKNSALDEQIKNLTAEIASLKKSGIKSLVSEVSKRNALANKISHYVGTFDHEDKTLDEVAKYGVDKLGIKCPEGHEQTALDAYFLYRNSFASAHATDSAPRSASLDEYLKPKA